MTIRKPEKFPEWAKDLVQDPINKEFNRYEPPTAKKDVGWARGEVPPRQWLNYQAWLVNDWIEYLYDRLHKPTIYRPINATTSEVEKVLPDPADSEGWIVYIDPQTGQDGYLAISNGTRWRKVRMQNL